MPVVFEYCECRILFGIANQEMVEAVVPNAAEDGLKEQKGLSEEPANVRLHLISWPILGPALIL